MKGRLQVWGRIAAALAIAVIVPACDDDSSGTGVSTGGGVATPLQWTNQSTGLGGAGTGGGIVTPLLWIDPNLGSSGAGGGTGALTYSDVDPVQWPAGSPQGQNPICAPAVQNAQTQQDETDLEGYVAAYYASLVQAGGAGGFGGGGLGGFGGGGIGVQLVPPTYITPALRPVIRAWVQNLGNPTPTGGVSNAFRLTACQINYSPGTEADMTATGGTLTSATAWGMMQNAAQAYVANVTTQGWCSAGSWTNAGAIKYMGIQFIQTPVGQTP